MNHPSPLRHDSDAKLPAAAYLRYESRADGWSPGRQAAFLVASRRQWRGRGCGAQCRDERRGRLCPAPQARGYAFNLGWEAALIIARRVISDRLMTAAIKGEEARWVREDGVTTYTRQNTKLSLALLDRINPATTLAEVMAVATRFDWFLQLIDEGRSPAEELWDLFFDDALPHSDIEARARVRASLLLSEESAGFEEEDEEEDEDKGPIEYKSMDGPPTPNGQSRKAHSLSSATSAPLRDKKFGSRRGAENAESLSAVALHSGLPLGEMPALDQGRHHPGRDHQNAAIIEHPDGKANPARLCQRPCPRENQQVGCDKGHSAEADAVAREIAVPRTGRHACDEQV
jgi:hypothetical protein